MGGLVAEAKESVFLGSGLGTFLTQSRNRLEKGKSRQYAPLHSTPILFFLVHEVMSEFAVPSAPKPKQPPQGPALAYSKPEWSSPAKQKYSFEILKNGAVVQEFEGPAREFITVGE